jgi:hypothetical protein
MYLELPFHLAASLACHPVARCGYMSLRDCTCRFGRRKSAPCQNMSLPSDSDHEMPDNLNGDIAILLHN